MSKIVLTRDEERFGLFDLFLKEIKTHRKKLYLFSTIVTLFALVGLLLTPNEYTASIRFMPDSSSPTDRLTALASSVLPSDLLASTVGVSAQSESNTLRELFKSRTVYDAVLGHSYTGLDHTPDGSLYAFFDIDHPQYARDKLSSILSFNEQLKSGVITIAATTNDAELSKQIVTRSVRELDNFKKALNRESGRQNKSFYTTELSRAREQLTVLREEQLMFLSRNRNYHLSTDPALVQQVRDYDSRLLRQQAITAGLEQMLTSIEMEINNNGPLLKIIEPAEKPLLKSGPPRSKYLLMAMIGSVLFGFGLLLLKIAYAWYFPKNTKHELQDSVKLVRDDVTGVVNRLKQHIPLKEKVTDK